MNLSNAKPDATGIGLAKASFLAGMPSEYNTTVLAINKLRARYGYSEAVAALVAQLAGLGPQAVRR